MKLFIYLMLCGVGMYAFQAQAMDGYGRAHKTDQGFSFALKVTSHEDECTKLVKLARERVHAIEKLNDLAELQGHLNELMVSKERIIESINDTIQSIKYSSLDYDNSQILIYRCFELLAVLKDLNFSEIESKIDFLKTSPQRGCRANLGANNKQAELLPLPASLSAKAVFYVKATHLRQLSCAYDVLYNACNLDECCGITNCYAGYTVFTETCLGYSSHKRSDPRKGIKTDMVKFLKNRFDLQLCGLCRRGSEVRPFCPEDYEASDMVKALNYSSQGLSWFGPMDCKNGKKLMEAFKEQFERSKKPCAIAHFFCLITRHAILISAIKNKTGIGLYIFDNCNAPINEDSEIKQYIDFICKEFNISPKNQFIGPRIPEIWPTTPRSQPHPTDPSY